MTAPSISVIVPTRAHARRAQHLHRALDSIITQARVRAQPVIVINGRECDSGLLAELRSAPDLVVLVQEAADLPGALEAGLAQADGMYVTSLDDDDLLLPNALALRCDALAAHADIDVVVTNGVRRDPTGDQVHITDMEIVRRDPLRALSEGNWLLPGSWLARTNSVSPWLYRMMPPYLECTYLALRFCCDLRMALLDEPTVVYNADSPDSLSRSLSYKEAQPVALQRLLELRLPAQVRSMLRDRIRLAWHELANTSLESGQLGVALRYHKRTLLSQGGWRHLPFARHLLAAWWRRVD